MVVVLMALVDRAITQSSIASGKNRLMEQGSTLKLCLPGS